MSKIVSEIAPLDLYGRMKSGEDIHLIDVRSSYEFNSGHVVNAQSIPLDSLSRESLLMHLEKAEAGSEKPLYITCKAGFRAEQAAQRLAAEGLENLVLIQGGTDAWEKAGLPVKRQSQMISLERQVQITIGVLLVMKVIFGFAIHELFFVGAALIGAGLIVAGITRWCGIAEIFAKLPWNRRHTDPAKAVHSTI